MKKSGIVRCLFVAAIGVLPVTSVMAQKAAEAQAPTSLSETYDAWTVRCANQKQGEKTRRICQMSQQLMQQGTRQRVLTFVLATADKGAKATLVFPFGLLLADGFRVRIAEDEILRGAYRTCLPAGCVAEVDLPADTIGKLENAKTATVLMTANSGQEVKTNVSLMGFKAAYRRLINLTTGSGK